MSDQQLDASQEAAVAQLISTWLVDSIPAGVASRINAALAKEASTRAVLEAEEANLVALASPLEKAELVPEPLEVLRGE